MAQNTGEQPVLFDVAATIRPARKKSVRKKKEYCKRGHPRTPGNVSATGSCYECMRVWAREQKAKPAAARPPSDGPICAKPTRKFPDGRTGTNAGFAAHSIANESPCDPCRLAQLAYQKLLRVEVPPEESRRRRKQAGRQAWERKTAAYADRLICEIPTTKHPEGRTGTVNGYYAHWHKGEEACKPCLEAVASKEKAKRAGDPFANRRMNLVSRFNITLATYEEMLARQGGGCAVCGAPHPRHVGGVSPSGFHVDHDHACCPGKKSCGDCVRGLLCGPCNTGMGNLGDDPERLIAAANYLLAARKRRSDAETATPAEAGDAA